MALDSVVVTSYDIIIYYLLSTCWTQSWVRSAAAGAHHTLVSSSSGEVYSWGKGTAGQLGLNEPEAKLTLQICVQAAYKLL